MHKITFTLPQSPAPGVCPEGISPDAVRSWARNEGYIVRSRGRLPQTLINEYIVRNPITLHIQIGG